MFDLQLPISSTPFASGNHSPILWLYKFDFLKIILCFLLQEICLNLFCSFPIISINLYPIFFSIHFLPSSVLKSKYFILFGKILRNRCDNHQKTACPATTFSIWHIYDSEWENVARVYPLNFFNYWS